MQITRPWNISTDIGSNLNYDFKIFSSLNNYDSPTDINLRKWYFFLTPECIQLIRNDYPLYPRIKTRHDFHGTAKDHQKGRVMLHSSHVMSILVWVFCKKWDTTSCWTECNSIISWLRVHSVWRLEKLWPLQLPQSRLNLQDRFWRLGGVRRAQLSRKVCCPSSR